MKRLKKPTYEQKKRLSKKGFNPSEFLFLKAVDDKLVFAKKDNINEIIEISIPR